MKKMVEGIALLVLGILLLNALMYFQQPGMIFFPWPEIESTPAHWGLSYEDVRLETEDGVALHGWYVPAEDAKQVVLFLHGNAGNISHRRESVGIFVGLGFDVFIFDYRGYGLSEGAPSEKGLYSDALAAWRYLTGQRGFDPADVVVFGRSLGGAVAARLASEVTPRAVVLESTFSSARDFAARVFPLLSRVVVLRYDFNSADAIRHARAPVLVLHSPEDEIMPFELGRRLFAAAPEPKEFVTLRGDHNYGFSMSRPEYDRALRDFLAAAQTRMQ